MREKKEEGQNNFTRLDYFLPGRATFVQKIIYKSCQSFFCSSPLKHIILLLSTHPPIALPSLVSCLIPSLLSSITNMLFSHIASLFLLVGTASALE
jgi:hypothetical protein